MASINKCVEMTAKYKGLSSKLETKAVALMKMAAVQKESVLSWAQVTPVSPPSSRILSILIPIKHLRYFLP